MRLSELLPYFCFVLFCAYLGINLFFFISGYQFMANKRWVWLFVVDDARGEKSPENSEMVGLLKPPEAGGNIPRSPSSEAVQKV